MNNKDRKLVYSDDPKDKALIEGSKEQLIALKEKITSDSNQKLIKNDFTIIFRIEKNGRGGKTVTIMDKFPPQDKFLSELTKEMKSKCGVGGTYLIEQGFGRIEIQGDKREALKKLLDIKKYKYKGV